MKTMSLLVLYLLSYTFGFSQVEKREIRKTVEIEVNEENGKTKTTVRTEENGKVSEEVYEGKHGLEKAEKVREQYKADAREDKTIEVEIKEKKGKKTLTIKETENGQTKISVFKGEKAEKKLKDMQNFER